MATPVNNSYSVPVGVTCKAGIGTSLVNPRPAWRTAMTPFTWTQVGTNTLKDFDPTDDPLLNPNYYNANKGLTWKNQDQIFAWGGFCWDEAAKRLFIFGGGHNNYWGNEAYEWDAMTAAYSRLNNPWGSIGDAGYDTWPLNIDDNQEASCVFANGQPRSFHTYDNWGVRDGTIWFFGGSPCVAGGVYGRPFIWNEALSQWDMDAAVAPGTGAGGATYDPTRDIFYILRTGLTQPRAYNPSTKAASVLARFVGAGTYCSLKYHPGHDLLVCFTETNLEIMRPYGSTNAIVPTQSGTVPAYDVFGKCGAQYDAVNDRFYLFRGNQTWIDVLTPPPAGSDPFTATWAWSTIEAGPSNTVTPPAGALTGTYGKFWYSPALGACGVCASNTSQMYVFSMD